MAIWCISVLGKILNIFDHNFLVVEQIFMHVIKLLLFMLNTIYPTD